MGSEGGDKLRDGQVHRILAGGTGPRYLEAVVALAGQHEDALAAGNHEVQLPVSIQVAALDRGGRASDNDVDPIGIGEPADDTSRHRSTQF